MKKHNTKGFSLVELIVVIAIMAVLVGVLAPSLLRYVEKTRIQKDASAVSEVIEAAKLAMADEEVFKDTSSGATITITSGTDLAEAFSGTAGTGETNAKLVAEVKKIVGDAITFASGNASSVTLTVTKTADGTVSVAVTSPTSSATTDWGKAVAAVK